MRVFFATASLALITLTVASKPSCALAAGWRGTVAKCFTNAALSASVIGSQALRFIMIMIGTITWPVILAAETAVDGVIAFTVPRGQPYILRIAAGPGLVSLRVYRTSIMPRTELNDPAFKR